MIVHRSRFALSQLHLRCFIIGCICFTGITMLHAKVRPSDINYPTDENGLSKGYATPPPAYAFHFLGGYQSTTEPFEQRRLVGVDMRINAAYKGNEIRARWLIFHHTLSNALMNEGAMRASHINVDWRWLWGTKNHRPYLSIGTAIPMSELTNISSNQTMLKLDSAQMLAGILGGLDPWLWTHNSLSGVLKMGWHRLSRGGFRLNLDAGVAHVHQIMDHDALETFNHVQAKAMLGYDKNSFAFLVGGAYAMQVGGVSDDPNQISAHIRTSYRRGDYTYVLGGVYNIDAPYGSGGFGFWGLSLGIEYK